MLTPIEWLIFGCVLLFVISSAAFLQRLQTSGGPSDGTSGSGGGLRWLNSLERKPSSENHEPTEKFDRWLHRAVSQSGIGLDLPAFLLANAGAAVLAGYVAFLFELRIVLQVLIGLTVFALGLIIVWMMYRNRNKKFDEQFPSTLELMSSAVAAGECFEDAIRVAEESTQYPMKEELQRCISKVELGMPADQAIQYLAYRNPTMPVRLFAHTVSVHQEMGGRLGEALQRLANVIQERREINQKIRSATSLGRFAAIMISSVGIAALAYLVLFHPDYIGQLLESKLGRQMTIYGVISEVIGIIWVALSLDPEI